MNTYTLVEKRKTGGGKVAILERPISGRKYFTLLQKADPNRITVKKRIKCFCWRNQYFELIEFIQPDNNITILRTETEHPEQQVELPPFIWTEKEVTGDQNYFTFTHSVKK